MRSFLVAEEVVASPADFSRTPWGAADLRDSLLSKRWPHTSELRLFVAEGDAVQPCASPGPLDLGDLLRHLGACPGPGSPEERSDLFRVVSYREAARLAGVDSRAPRDGVCLLWPQPLHARKTATAASALLWEGVLAQPRGEPHASLLRAIYRGTGAHLVVQQGVLDALWGYGFPDLPEASGFPLMSALPAHVIGGYIPVGWDSGSFRRLALYDARD